ncbi:MAG TPA: hypothetical protein VK775_15105, partial [Chthoniobacterales bacterium]|nr:hypothetical protein [Chthoniobacterales bacterium]
MTKASLLTTIAIVSSLTFLGTVGYGQDKPIKKDLKLAFLPKNINNPYNVIETNGSLDACKEIGAQGKVVGPSDASA